MDFFLAFCAVSACTSVTQEQKPAEDLGAAITAAAGAQQAIFNNYSTAEANLQLATSRQRKWLLHKWDETAQLSSDSSVAVEFEKRTRLLDALRLYGQLMETIATSKQDAALDANAKALAASLDKLGKNTDALRGLNRELDALGIAPSGSNGTAANLIATVISGLGDLVIDHEEAHEMKQAANSLEPALKAVIPIFEKENDNLVASIKSDNSQIRTIEGTFEQRIWMDKIAGTGEKYTSTMQVEADFAKLYVPADSQPMAAAWEAVEKANSAVAAQGNNLVALVEEAKDRAAGAIAFYKALPK